MVGRSLGCYFVDRTRFDRYRLRFPIGTTSLVQRTEPRLLDLNSPSMMATRCQPVYVGGMRTHPFIVSRRRLSTGETDVDTRHAQIAFLQPSPTHNYLLSPPTPLITAQLIHGRAFLLHALQNGIKTTTSSHRQNECNAAIILFSCGGYELKSFKSQSPQRQKTQR